LPSLVVSALALTSMTLASPLSTGYHSDAPSQASLAFAPLMADPPQPIQDAYIIVFKKDVSVDQITSHLSLLQQFTSTNPLSADDEGGIQHFYDGTVGIKGYAGRFSESTLDSIRMQPEVDYVEKDQLVHTQGDVVKERNAPWVSPGRYPFSPYLTSVSR
jgi:cerevisin